MLPEIDGIQLLRRMKADPALRDIPVIMATAKGAEYDKILGLDLGADDYLTKPFLRRSFCCASSVFCSAAIGTNCGGLLQKRSSWASARCIWPMLWSACRMAPPSP